MESKSSIYNESGNLPPQDIELERAVLGALLLESPAYYDTAGTLSPEVFYNPAHSAIYSAIRHLAGEGIPIDMLTVINRLKDTKKLKDVGGATYLAHLTQYVASAMNITHHSRILWQLYVQREMIGSFTSLARSCYTEEFGAVEKEYQTVLSHLDRLFAGSGNEKHISAILRQHGNVIEERIRRAASNQIQGVTYGLRDLDQLTNGAQGGQLIVLAARPGMGKTAIALKFAKSAALDGKHTVISSLEMTRISLTDRLITSYAGIDGKKLRTGRMGREDLMAYENASSALARLDIYIDDTAGAPIGRLCAMARAKHRKGELDILIIDYLQLIEGDPDIARRETREREVGIITGKLKKLAKDIDIPVILLCQLNRAAESRSDKKPQAFDLRESGNIEQDADVIMMPFRPAYYPELTFYKNNTTIEYPEDVGVLFVRKQRDGETGEVQFRYSKDLSKITDYDDYDVEPEMF